jgi:hypothetical protein
MSAQTRRRILPVADAGLVPRRRVPAGGGTRFHGDDSPPPDARELSGLAMSIDEAGTPTFPRRTVPAALAAMPAEPSATHRA